MSEPVTHADTTSQTADAARLLPADVQESVARLAQEHRVSDVVVAAAAMLALRFRWSRHERQELPTPAGGALEVDLDGHTRFAELLAQLAREEARIGAGGSLDVGDLAAVLAVDEGADGSPVPRQRWADALSTLLRSAASDPQSPVDTMPLLSDADAAAAAAAADDACTDYPDRADSDGDDHPDDHTDPSLDLVHRGVERAARRWPDAVAVESGGTQVSYRDLDRRAAALASTLRDRGVGPEDRVGVLLDRSVELAVALLAVLKAGAAVVPLDRRMPVQRVRAIVDDGSVAVVITQEDLRSRLDPVPVQLVTVPPHSDVAAGDEVGPPVAVTMANVAFCYYTSGSTGEPKGVLLDHRCVSGRLAWLRQRYPLEPGDRVIHKTPLIFDVAIWELFGTLATGATVLMADPGAEADVEHLSRLLATERTRFVHFVASMLDAYLTSAPLAPHPDLRWVQVSGEAVPAGMPARSLQHFAAEFHNAYGQTETSEVAVWEASPETADTAPVPIGSQVGLYRLPVVDELLRPVPPGVPGELCVAGAGGLARGYVNRPALTAEKFVPHPYPRHPGERLYRTGDVAVAGADGTLVHLGRLDAQVKIRGCRVETGEVEAVVARHPEVRACAVVARPDDHGVDQLVAYVVADGLPANRLAAWVSRYLPSYMLPEAYVAMDALPLTASGKLDRRSLLAPTPSDRAALAVGSPPDGPIELALARIWQEVLGVDFVGRTDNFFDVGGNSLRSLQVLLRVRAVFEVDVPVPEFFAAPTIETFAESIKVAVVDYVAGLSDGEVARQLAKTDG